MIHPGRTPKGKKFALLYFTLVLLLMLPIPVKAAVHGFDATPLSEADELYFLEHFGIEPVPGEGYPNAICCFDVHPDGRIALGFEQREEKRIHVYDQNGVFLYGYQFDCNGSFACCWNGENMTIYLVRSMYLVTIDPQGQILSVEKQRNTEKSRERFQEIMDRAEMTVGTQEYRLERDMGISARSHSRLVVTDQNGTERILYDVTQAHNLSTIVKLVFMLCFAVLCLWGTFRKTADVNKEAQDN